VRDAVAEHIWPRLAQIDRHPQAGVEPDTDSLFRSTRRGRILAKVVELAGNTNTRKPRALVYVEGGSTVWQSAAVRCVCGGELALSTLFSAALPPASAKETNVADV
jgi:hypothetical protein